MSDWRETFETYDEVQARLRREHFKAERDALAARVEELEAIIDRARGVLNDPLVRSEHARRRARLLLLRGEDERDG